jgi:hypothetical protein
MIVKILPSGRSFKGLADYLTHDPKARTADRVAWTHSLNCANDDVLSVVHEMYTTFCQAELLKEEAGVRAGGRALDKAVKHLSLNWHPDEPAPSREEMIAATESLLERLDWNEHQAFLVAHSDKEHPHVHVMLNAVHPETGLKLNDSLEKRKVQEWALEYEREHGNILCRERLLNVEERQPSPNRQIWEKLKESERNFEQDEQRRAYSSNYLDRADQRTVTITEEWSLLKTRQREEREAFFAGGKDAYREVRNEVYREVREEFREDWAQLYAAKRAGLDGDRLAEIKVDILERQNAVLDERREEPCAALRKERDAEYDALLLEQKCERRELTKHQELGLSSPRLLDLAYPAQTPEPDTDRTEAGDEARERERAFRSAADETCEQPEPRRQEEALPEPVGITAAENPRVKDPVSGIGDLGLGALGAIAEIGERLFDGFFGGRPAPGNSNHPHKTAPEPKREANDNSLARAVDAAARRTEQEESDRRAREFWQERERERER